MTDTTISTKHALKRAKERHNLKSTKEANRDFKNALERGKKAEDFSGVKKQYLLNKTNDDAYAIAYNNYCYIFSYDNCALTSFQLSKNFTGKKYYDGKKQIRNPKKYIKNYETLDISFNDYSAAILC